MILCHSLFDVVIHNVAEGGEIVLPPVAVHPIIDGNEMDVVHGENGLCELAYFQVIPAQAGHILDDDRGDFPCLHQGHHLLEPIPVHGDAGNAVIHKNADIFKLVTFRIIREQGFLKRDLSRVFSPTENKTIM